MNPHPVAQLFDTHAEAYQAQFMAFAPYVQTYQNVLKHLPQKPLAVLDIGCGPANISAYLMNNHPFELSVTGLDLSEQMLALARQNIPSGRFLNLSSGDILSLEQRFDLVLCGFCVPYLSPAETRQLCVDMALCLAPQGVVYLSAIVSEQQGISEVQTKGVVQYRYPEEFLEDCLNEAGLRVLSQSSHRLERQHGPSEPEVFYILSC